MIATYQLSSGYSFQFYLQLADVPAEIWEQLQSPENTFLSISYLKALTHSPPKGYSFGFVIFFQETIPIGITVFQKFSFRAIESVQLSPRDGWFKRWLLQKINFQVLVCGNSMITGEYLFHFHSSIEEQQGLDLIFQTVTVVKKEIWQEIDLITFKEFFSTRQFHIPKSYNQLSIQPNMILVVKDSWNQMEDYVWNLKSKYRTQVKRTFRKFEPLERKVLRVEEIWEQRAVIHQLYLQVVQNQDLNVAQLTLDYFYQMQLQLGDDFRLVAYFRSAQIVGFYTTIANGKELVGHFLGYERSLNPSHQLYFNSLLDIVKDGIELGFQQITFARTALEIKSALGATPNPMHGYVRHYHPILNRLLGLLLRYYSPDSSWIARHPFKTNSKQPTHSLKS